LARQSAIFCFEDPHSPARRRLILGLAVLAVTGLAPALVAPRRAVASPMFPFIPDHYTFTHDQVFSAVARKFPYRRTLAQVFDLSLVNPAVGFEPDVNRVSVSADVALTSPFLQQPVNGSMTLNTQLVYDAPSRSVLLKSPQVERTQFGASAAEYQQQINAALAVAATQLLDNYPIYTFQPDQLSFAGAQFEPGAITVQRDGIKVEIVQRSG
jgi:hypothetical protein